MCPPDIPQNASVRYRLPQVVPCRAMAIAQETVAGNPFNHGGLFF
jgi:hypothetical protein